jgi:recombination protein RecA
MAGRARRAGDALAERKRKGVMARRSKAAAEETEFDKVIGADGELDLDAAAAALRTVDETAERVEKRSALAIPGVVSTRNALVNAVIGRGGVPRGRITVFHGKEASGKTTLLLQALAEVQAMGGLAVMIDREHKLDVDYAFRLGFDVERAIISHAQDLDTAIHFIDSAIGIARRVREAKGFSVPMVIGVDSLNALVPKAWLETDAEADPRVGLQARMWSSAMPRINRALAKEDVALVLISQVRAKIGVMYGPKEEIAGGNAVKFYASLILQTKRDATLTRKDEPVGSVTIVKATKNSIGVPFRTAKVELRFGEGFDHDLALLQRCLDLGILEKKGNWISYGGAQLGNGAHKATTKIREDAELRQLLSDHVWKAEGFGFEPPAVPPSWAADDDDAPIDVVPEADAEDDDDDGAAAEPVRTSREARAAADAKLTEKMRGKSKTRTGRGKTKAKAKA